MLIAERFIASLINKFGKHPVSTYGGTWYPPQACNFLKLKHHLYSSLEKRIIKGQCNISKIELKGLTTTCNKKRCKLKHV